MSGSCLADDAVRCEPVSRGNSLLTGKFAGNPRNGRTAVGLFFVFSKIWRLFPYSDSREFFALEQGKFLPLQGIQGISFASWAGSRSRHLNLQTDVSRGATVRPSSRAPCHQALELCTCLEYLTPSAA